MKHLFSIIIVIGILGLLVVPGLPGDYRHSFGHGGRAQFVTIDFMHDTQYDVHLWPPDCGSDPLCLSEIAELERWCKVVHAPGAALEGDVVGVNVLLSDVICFDGHPIFQNPPPTTARVEAMGLIIGDLESGPINMSGRMVLDIDLSNGFPAPMNGYWVFQKGVGTHYGVLFVNGTTDGFVGTGTYKGWIRENR